MKSTYGGKFQLAIFHVDLHRFFLKNFPGFLLFWLETENNNKTRENSNDVDFTNFWDKSRQKIFESTHVLESSIRYFLPDALTPKVSKPPFWQLGSISQWFVELEAIMEMRRRSTIRSSTKLLTKQLLLLVIFQALKMGEFYAFLWLFWANKHVTILSDTREIQSWPAPKWN